VGADGWAWGMVLVHSTGPVGPTLPHSFCRHSAAVPSCNAAPGLFSEVVELPSSCPPCYTVCRYYSDLWFFNLNSRKWLGSLNLTVSTLMSSALHCCGCSGGQRACAALQPDHRGCSGFHSVLLRVQGMPPGIRQLM
jgi:hypothetical protein